MASKGRIQNWATQIRKGYLELSILTLIQSRQRVYGFEILEVMERAELPVKEGTLYPLLNRMASEGWLAASWQTENLKGHPRKFYSLTKEGETILKDMQSEFEKLTTIYNKFKE
jgi:PadR family transcriptional regulator PadR